MKGKHENNPIDDVVNHSLATLYVYPDIGTPLHTLEKKVATSKGTISFSCVYKIYVVTTLLAPFYKYNTHLQCSLPSYLLFIVYFFYKVQFNFLNVFKNGLISNLTDDDVVDSDVLGRSVAEIFKEQI